MFDGLKLRVGRGVFGERGPLATSCIERRRDTMQHCVHFLLRRLLLQHLPLHGLRPPRVRLVPVACL